MPRSYAIKDWNDVERSFRIVASTARPVRCTEWDPTAGPNGQGAVVEFWEALEGWNLERFAKNPLILESHYCSDINAAVGLASDIKWDEAAKTLEMKVTLAPANAAPRTAEIENRIKAGILRGVSVGYDYGDRTDEKRDGKTVRVYRNNKLNEVSLVLLPADEDALVETADEETQRADRLSNAGRALASARKARTDAKDGAFEQRYDFLGSISSFTRSQVGGIVVPARVTRTGVLHYRRPDGTIRRELRLPSEVFNSDSLSTLHGATVTDLEHHRGLLNTSNWKDATLGHATEVRRDGKYLMADLVINDARAVADVEGKRLHDISCGYSCKLDHEAGTWEGEPYDCIQRSIRYNHVAVLPKGTGRAGPDVALQRFDAKDADCVEAPTGESTMTEPAKRVIRIDGKDLDYGSEAHINHIEKAHLDDIEKHEKTTKELQAKCDAADGRCDAAEKAAKKAEDDYESDDAKAKRRKRSALIRRAIRLLASDDDDGDEGKMDALDEKLDALDDKGIMLAIIRTDADYKDDKSLDDKSIDYVQAIFDRLTKSGVTRADGVDSVANALEIAKRTDSGDRDELAKPRAEMQQRAEKAWQLPIS